jgi:hypothetical protein
LQNIRNAALQGCLAFLILLSATSASAQPPQPVVAPAPARPEFLSRFDYHMDATHLAIDDERFSWDTSIGGSFDVLDYVVGRLGVRVDYEAVLGDELRPFDANQATYALEWSVSARVDDRTELFGIFHHVSRHLSDRPKPNAIAWNEIGARLIHRTSFRTTTIDADVEGGRVVQHSSVDYRWIGEARLLIRQPVHDRVALFAQGWGQMTGVDEMVNHRGTQIGGLAQAGVRIMARGATLEVYAGVEQRTDAYPIGFTSQHWGLAGFRLLSR